MDLKDLIKRLSEDKDFEAGFKDLDSVEALIENASNEGYTITGKEIETLRRELEYLSTGRMELCDEELDEVAGGFSILAMPMGPGMGPEPPWLTGLVNIFVDKSGVKHTSHKKGSIHAQKLPTNVSDMATSPLPHNSNSTPAVSSLPFGVLNPLDKPDTSI